MRALADRAPLPVELSCELDGRLPDPVEAAAYYVVAEALTNVAKYARANEVTVGVARENGHARIEVRDDGIGGADADRRLRAARARRPRRGARRAARWWTARRAPGRRCAPKSPVLVLARGASPSELLRAVTAALSSPDEETAYARLPGKLRRTLDGQQGRLGRAGAVDPDRRASAC